MQAPEHIPSVMAALKEINVILNKYHSDLNLTLGKDCADFDIEVGCMFIVALVGALEGFTTFNAQTILSVLNDKIIRIIDYRNQLSKQH